jgi:predicted acetylornithine/succinylornithine family transaminase
MARRSKPPPVERCHPPARGSSPLRVHAPERGENRTMTMVMDDIQTRESRYVLQTYRRQPVTFVRGEGIRLYDAEGQEYFDLLSGIGVASLGHANPGLARVIAEQSATLLHTSNLFFHPLQGQLAERLAALSGLSRAFFCNSGAEAVEACLKFARRYWYTRGEPRAEFVALENSFHGRTFGALSVTSDPHYRGPFEPLVPGVRWVPADNPAALAAAVSPRTAAIIVEGIQGEGGVRPLSPAFAAAVNEASAESGALIIADEIQCGLGRTGHPFYFTTLGIKPHLSSLGKALGGGVPIGAALISEEVASTISFGDHGTTYGGNLLACRAALYFLEQLVEGGVLANVERMGRFFQHRLADLAARHPIVKEVRGAGLIWGLELTCDAAPVVPAGLDRRVIVNRTAETVVRLLPPLVITEAEADEALNRLDAALATLA